MSTNEAPMSAEVREAVELLNTLPVGSIVQLPNGRVAQVGDYHGRRKGKPLEVAGERGEVDVRDISPVRNLPLTVLRVGTGGEFEPGANAGRLSVTAREFMYHYPSDHTFTVEADGGLTVFDASSKVAAVFQQIYWSAAQYEPKAA